MPQIESPVVEVALSDPEAIAVLLDVRQRTAFLPFVAVEKTVKRAALEVGESPNTTLSRVKRWRRLGLLRVVRRERHARGESLVYRSSGDAYWVPYRSTPAESLVELARSVYLPMLERVVRNYAQVGAGMTNEWGLLFERHQQAWAVTPRQALHCDCSPLSDEAPAALLQLETLRLHPRDAKDFQRELDVLLSKFRSLGRPDGRPFDVVIGLAPHADS